MNYPLSTIHPPQGGGRSEGRGGNLVVFGVNLDFLDLWPLGGQECVQNDATGCGIIFHTRQAPPQKLVFSSIFAGAAAAAEQSQVGRPPSHRAQG